MTTNVINPAEPVDYSTITTPSSYVCGNCERSGVKLWRNTYAMSTEDVTLSCAECAGAEYDVDVSKMTNSGLLESEYGLTTNIGWRVAAVPTPENHGFWGATSTPVAGKNWWYFLPIR